jgi:hypothetical protein
MEENDEIKFMRRCLDLAAKAEGLLLFITERSSEKGTILKQESLMLKLLPSIPFWISLL